MPFAIAVIKTSSRRLLSVAIVAVAVFAVFFARGCARERQLSSSRSQVAREFKYFLPYAFEMIRVGFPNKFVEDDSESESLSWRVITFLVCSQITDPDPFNPQELDRAGLSKIDIKYKSRLAEGIANPNFSARMVMVVGPGTAIDPINPVKEFAHDLLVGIEVAPGNSSWQRKGDLTLPMLQLLEGAEFRPGSVLNDGGFSVYLADHHVIRVKADTPRETLVACASVACTLNRRDLLYPHLLGRPKSLEDRLLRTRWDSEHSFWTW